MLHHHSSENYNVAASEAAASARAMMEEVLHRGKESAIKLIEHVNTHVPDDSLARGRMLRFRAGLLPQVHQDDAPSQLTIDDILQATEEKKDRGEPSQLLLDIADHSVAIHRHALSQIATRSGVNGRFISDHANGAVWERELLADVLNRHFAMDKSVAEERYLLREYDKKELRGFLSSTYRRLDDRPLVEQFVNTVREMGAIPCEGLIADTQVEMKAWLPMVFEPVDHEVMLVGLRWKNSNYGAGAHEVNLVVLRLWCTNKACMENCLRNIHLGKRLNDNIKFSEETYRADTRATMLTLRDAIKDFLSPDHVNTLVGAIREANDKGVEWKNVKTALDKALLKDEIKKVQSMFEGDDIIQLPPAKSLWRASNALSLLAGQTDDVERKLQLERYAGALLRGDKLTSVVTEIE